MIDALARLQRTIGYEFRDLDWLRLALTHRSVSGRRNNERLEFLGDGLLNFAVADSLYLQFPQEDEGRLSRLRATLVRQDSLAIIAREWSLGDYLVMGSGELKSGGYRRESILSDTVEAVIGAMHRDGEPMPEMTEHIRRWYGERLTAIVVGDGLKDPKSRLQEWLQARRLDLPHYEVLLVTGEAHDQFFKVRCDVPEISPTQPAFSTEGNGVSRRFAEQEAANMALQKILPPAKLGLRTGPSKPTSGQ
ncbi:MAG: ribonuclease III [Paraperlucidibaca sp.]